MRPEAKGQFLSSQELQSPSPKQKPGEQLRLQQEQHQVPQRQQDHAHPQQQQLQGRQPQPQSPKRQRHAFQGQQQRQEQWRMHDPWQAQQQMCGLAQQESPGLQRQRRQLSPPSQQLQQQGSLTLHKPVLSSVILEERAAPAPCAFEQQQQTVQQQRQTPWQQQQQPDERVGQQEHTETMRQQQQQDYSQQHSTGEPVLGQGRAWGPERQRFSLSPQLQQNSTAQQQHDPTPEQQPQQPMQPQQRLQPQQRQAFSEPHDPQRTHGDYPSCLSGTPPNDFVLQQQQQQSPCIMQQQQQIGQRRRRGTGEFDKQKQHVDEACAEFSSFAAAGFDGTKKEGDREQLVGCVAAAAGIPEALVMQLDASPVLVEQQSWQVQLCEQERHRQPLLQKQHTEQEDDEEGKPHQVQQLLRLTTAEQLEPQHRGSCFEEKLLHALPSQMLYRVDPWKEQQLAQQQEKEELQFGKEVSAAVAAPNLSSAGSGEAPASPPINIRATVAVLDTLEQDRWEQQSQQTRKQLLPQDLQQQHASVLSHEQQKFQLHSLQVQERKLHHEQLQQEQQQLLQVPQERHQQQLQSGQWQQQEQHAQLQQQQQPQHQQKVVGENCSIWGSLDDLRPAAASSNVSSPVFFTAERSENIHLLSTAGSLPAPTKEHNKLLSMSHSGSCLSSSSSDSSNCGSSSSTQYGCSGGGRTATALSLPVAGDGDHRESRCSCNNENSNQSSSGCTCSSGRRRETAYATSGNVSRGNLASSSVSGSVSGSSSGRDSSTERSIRSRSARSGRGITCTCSDASLVEPAPPMTSSSSCFARSSDAATSHITQGVAAGAAGNALGRWGETREKPRKASLNVLPDEGERLSNSGRGRGSSRSCMRGNGRLSSTSYTAADSRCELREWTSSKREADDSMSSREAACNSYGCSSRRTRRGRSTSRGTDATVNSRSCRVSDSKNFGSHQRGPSTCSQRRSSGRCSSGSCGRSSGSSSEHADVRSTAFSSRARGTDICSRGLGEDFELLLACSDRRRRSRKMSTGTSRRLEYLRRKGSFGSKKARDGRRWDTRSGRGKSSNGRKGSFAERESSTSRSSCDSSRRKAAVIMQRFNMLADTLAGEGGKELASSPALPAAGVKTHVFSRAESRTLQQEEQNGQQQYQPPPWQQHRQPRRQQKRWVQQQHGEQVQQHGGQVQQHGGLLQQNENLFFRGREGWCSSEEGWQGESIALDVLDRHVPMSLPVVEDSIAGSSCHTPLTLRSIKNTSSNSNATGGCLRNNSGDSKGTSSSSDNLASNSESLKRFRGRHGRSSRQGAACSLQKKRPGSCTGAGESIFPELRCGRQSMEHCGAAIIGDSHTKETQWSNCCSKGSGDNGRDICCGKESSVKNNSRLYVAELLQAAQNRHTSNRSNSSDDSSNKSSRAADKTACVNVERSASSSRPSTSGGQHSSNQNRGRSSPDTQEPHLGRSRESPDVQRWNSNRSGRAVLTQEDHGRGMFSSTSSKVDGLQNLSGLKHWAMETFDVLPDAWVVGHIDAVATTGQAGLSPAGSSTGGISPTDLASVSSVRTTTRPRNGVRGAAAEAAEAVPPVAQAHAAAVAAAPAAASAADVAAGEETAGDTAAHATATSASSRATSSVCTSMSLSVPAVAGAAKRAGAGALEGAAATPAAAGERASESEYLLQEYMRREGAAAATAAKKARQESMKSVIRQQLLQQYSNMLQQLQQHKAAAQLVQDDSEPLRAALVRVVAAEAKLKKLQHSERWRKYVDALIHDADNDLVEFMAHFGTPADELSVSKVKTTEEFTLSRKGRKKLRFSLMGEEVVVEDIEEKNEENQEETDQEGVGKAIEDEADHFGCATMVTPLFRLLLGSSSTARRATSSRKGTNTRKSARNTTKTTTRSRAGLLLKFVVGYVVLCGSLFLWLRHTIHQL